MESINLSIRVSWVEQGLLLDERPGYVQQLASGSTPRYLGGLASSPQPLVENSNNRVVSCSTEGSQVQSSARSLLATMPNARPASHRASRLVRHWSQADVGGERLY